MEYHKLPKAIEVANGDLIRVRSIREEIFAKCEELPELIPVSIAGYNKLPFNAAQIDCLLTDAENRIEAELNKLEEQHVILTKIASGLLK